MTKHAPTIFRHSKMICEHEAKSKTTHDTNISKKLNFKFVMLEMTVIRRTGASFI